MRLRAELAEQLVRAAADDIRKLYRECDSDGRSDTVVFVVDFNDRIGKSFVETFVPPERLSEARAVGDGGVRAGAIGTFLHPMPAIAADIALSKMNETGASLADHQEEGYVTVLVVAFGRVTPFKISSDLTA